MIFLDLFQKLKKVTRSRDMTFLNTSKRVKHPVQFFILTNLLETWNINSKWKDCMHVPELLTFRYAYQ